MERINPVDEIVDLTAEDDDDRGAIPITAQETMIIRPIISQARDAVAQAPSRQEALAAQDYVKDQPTAPSSTTPTLPSLQPPSRQPVPQVPLAVDGRSVSDTTPVAQPALSLGIPFQSHAISPGGSFFPPSAVQDERIQRPKRQVRQRVSFKDEDEGPQHLSRSQSGTGSRRPTMETMQSHLDQLFIGYRPGDPTVDDLPDALPPPLHPISVNIQHFNLAEWTQHDLMVEAATTAGSVLADSTSLSNGGHRQAPPAPRSRLGRFTGQEDLSTGEEHARDLHGAGHPSDRVVRKTEGTSGEGDPTMGLSNDSRRQITNLLPSPTGARSFFMDEAVLRGMHSYLSTNRDPPWREIGRDVAPIVGGTPLSLLSMWREVQALGGSDKVTELKKWTSLASRLGVDASKSKRAGYAVKNAYMKYLMPYEDYVQRGEGLAQGEGPHVSGTDAGVGMEGS